EGEAPDAGADRDPDPVALALDAELGIGERLLGRGQGEVDEQVSADHVAARQVIERIEVRDLPRDLAREGRRVEPRDPTDTRDASRQGVPEGLDANADR